MMMEHLSRREEEKEEERVEHALKELCKDCNAQEFVEDIFELRELCWENEFGKELIEQVYLDSLKTIALSLITDLGRAVFVRYAHSFWCWDLESGFPGYEEFKTGEAILEHIQVQFFVWIAAFFAPGTLLLSVVRLVVLMYYKSWLCNASNIPSESVYRAGSANFYYIILLSALFIVMLLMGFLVVIIPPSFHCGPFSEYPRIYEILADRLTRAVKTTLSVSENGTIVRAPTTTRAPRNVSTTTTTIAPPRDRLKSPPVSLGTERIYEYIVGPGFIIPIIVLLLLFIWYLISGRGVLHRVNRDLKRELQVERTEGKKKAFSMANNNTAKDNKSSTLPPAGPTGTAGIIRPAARRPSLADVFREVMPTAEPHLTANLGELLAPSDAIVAQIPSAHRKDALVDGLFAFETKRKKALTSAEVKQVAQEIIDIFGVIELDSPEASNEAEAERLARQHKAERKLSKQKENHHNKSSEPGGKEGDGATKKKRRKKARPRSKDGKTKNKKKKQSDKSHALENGTEAMTTIPTTTVKVTVENENAPKHAAASKTKHSKKNRQPGQIGPGEIAK